MLLPDTLLEIVKRGGGLKIDLGFQVYLPQTLIGLASAASSSGATLIIKISDTLLLPDTMKEIATAGGGRVIFEI